MIESSLHQVPEFRYVRTICANSGAKPYAEDYRHDEVRYQAVGGNLMAGGAGYPWYFG
jgi:hypothetical protein